MLNCHGLSKPAPAFSCSAFTERPQETKLPGVNFMESTDLEDSRLALQKVMSQQEYFSRTILVLVSDMEQ